MIHDPVGFFDEGDGTVLDGAHGRDDRIAQIFQLGTLFTRHVVDDAVDEVLLVEFIGTDTDVFGTLLPAEVQAAGDGGQSLGLDGV